MNDHDSQIDSELALAEALDRWGSDLHDWPEAAATQAKRLLESSPAAKRLMQKTVALELALTQLGEHRATPGLDVKILEQLPPKDDLQRIVDWLAGALWRPALAAAIPLALGFALGVTMPEEDSQLADELSLMAFSATYEELEDDS